MINKIKSVKKVVLDMLQRFPKTRDNDRLLIVYVWSTQNPDLKSTNLSAREFATAFIEGKYADPESIRRTRQKLQESNPELRGKSYTYRNETLEPEVRNEMRTA